MLREIVSGLLIVLILITGFFTYIILFDVKEIKSPSLTLDIEQYNTETDIKSTSFKQSFFDPFVNSVQAQQDWLNLYQDTKQEYEEVFKAVLVNQELLFVEEYKDDLEDKRDQLDRDFNNFKERINKVTAKEIEYYSSLVEYEMEQSLENLRKNYDEEFAEYEKQVQEASRNELLNYRLKLETLDLTEEKAQKYRDKIEEIEAEKSIKINNKLNEIYYTLRIKSEELEAEKELKIAKLKEQFNREKDKQIEQKQLELENVLTVFQRRYAALKKQMNQFEKTLNQESPYLFQKKEVIKEIIQSDLDNLKKNYIVSTEERN